MWPGDHHVSADFFDGTLRDPQTPLQYAYYAVLDPFIKISQNMLVKDARTSKET